MVNVIGVIHLFQTVRYPKVLDQLNIDIWIQLAMFLDMLGNSDIGHLFGRLIVNVTEGLIVKLDVHGSAGFVLAKLRNLQQ